jgi:cytochrome c peroxidase
MKRLLPLILLAACAAEPEFTEDEQFLLGRMSPPPALEDDLTNAWADDADAAKLGRFLFYDAGLSPTGQFSCATCHEPEHGFAQNSALSLAAGETGRHTPTVLNSANNWFQFWDGRCDSQWCQAIGPIEDDKEMDSSRLFVAKRVHADAELKEAYEALFGAMPDFDDARWPDAARPIPDRPDDPEHVAWMALSEDDQDAVTEVMVGVAKAIAAYERQLMSGWSPFDDFVAALQADDAAAMDAYDVDARAGLKLFLGKANCTFCHFDAEFTNHQFANLGFEPREWLNPLDAGRFGGINALQASPFNAGGVWSDDPDGDRARRLGVLSNGDNQLGQFKVGGLRDIALSPPYMHGGQFDTLTDVVAFYNEAAEEPEVGHREEELLPLDLSDEEQAQLVAFLESLTGEALPAELTGPPDSPLP